MKITLKTWNFIALVANLLAAILWITLIVHGYAPKDFLAGICIGFNSALVIDSFMKM